MTSNQFARLLTATAAWMAVAGCAALYGSQPVAQAQLEARSGSQVSGVVTFRPQGDKVLVEARISGLTPGEHGFHLHDAGDCSAADASSARGHFNPEGGPHGHHMRHHSEHHAGDLPNLVADANGQANYKAEVGGLKLDNSPQGIVGRSVVVHADPDDYHSQPAGNSGKRVACGVITAR